MLFDNLFKKHVAVITQPREGFIRLSAMVRETEVFPETYLIRSGIALGITADDIPDLIYGGETPGNTNYTRWAIKEIVYTFIEERGFISNDEYKKLVNVVNKYGYTIEVLDEAIKDYADQKRKSDRVILNKQIL